mmetsp:Transcript_101953/g.202414  ORF Transcript_101953/g.202414 Transcript_101953/m.202414 type:complete len:84 (-) Transcript_101953:22-273(-)
MVPKRAWHVGAAAPTVDKRGCTLLNRGLAAKRVTLHGQENHNPVDAGRGSDVDLHGDTESKPLSPWLPLPLASHDSLAVPSGK